MLLKFNPYKYFGVNMTPINFSLVIKKWFPSSQWNKILLLFYIIYLYSYKKNWAWFGRSEGM